MAELRKIHRDILKEILELRVSESQESLCVHTAQALAQARAYKHCLTLCHMRGRAPQRDSRCLAGPLVFERDFWHKGSIHRLGPGKTQPQSICVIPLALWNPGLLRTIWKK